MKNLPFQVAVVLNDMQNRYPHRFTADYRPCYILWVYLPKERSTEDDGNGGENQSWDHNDDGHRKLQKKKRTELLFKIIIIISNKIIISNWPDATSHDVMMSWCNSHDATAHPVMELSPVGYPKDRFLVQYYSFFM